MNASPLRSPWVLLALALMSAPGQALGQDASPLDAWAKRVHSRVCRDFMKPPAVAKPDEPATLEPLPSPVRDFSKKPAFLTSEELATDSDLWRRWMTRDAEGEFAPYYMINSRLALEFFDDWFREGDLSNFKQTLDRFHYLSAVGDNGARIYHTFQTGTHYSSGDLFPGLNRGDAHEMGDMNFAAQLSQRQHPSFQIHRYPDTNTLDVANFILNDSLTFPLKIQVKVDSTHTNVGPPQVKCTATRKRRRYSLPMKFGPGPDSRDMRIHGYLEIDGLLDEARDCTAHECLPYNRMGNGLIHRAPAGSSVHAYFRLGQKHLQTLSALMRAPELDRAKILEALADYYHVLLNGHLYFRVNNSLLMNQVNYFLRMNGFRPVPHSDLDYWANALSTREFRRLFIEHISDYQN